MIDPKKAYTYFKNNFVIKKSTNGWWSLDCPFCLNGEDKKKMAVHFAHDRCKCWVCGYRGYIVDFVMAVTGKSYYATKMYINTLTPSTIDVEVASELRTARVSSIELPVGFHTVLEGTGVMSDRARRYLEGRKFDLDLMDKQGFGYCKKHDEDRAKDYFGYIIIPFKNRGVLNYYIGRDYIGNFLRYKNPAKEECGVGKDSLLFNEDALDMYKTVHVLEGWADAHTIGASACSTQGWSLSRDQKRKMLGSDAKHFVFIPDLGSENGVTFYHKAVKVGMEFMQYKDVSVVDLKPLEKYGKDVNEIVKKVGREALMEVIDSTKKLTEGKAISILMG